MLCLQQKIVNYTLQKIHNLKAFRTNTNTPPVLPDVPDVGRQVAAEHCQGAKPGLGEAGKS